MMTPVSRGISGHKASLVSHRAQHDYISFSVFSPIIVLNYRIACDTLIELSIFFWFHDHYQLQVLLYIRVYFIWEKTRQLYNALFDFEVWIESRNDCPSLSISLDWSLSFFLFPNCILLLSRFVSQCFLVGTLSFDLCLVDFFLSTVKIPDKRDKRLRKHTESSILSDISASICPRVWVSAPRDERYAFRTWKSISLLDRRKKHLRVLHENVCVRLGPNDTKEHYTTSNV